MQLLIDRDVDDRLALVVEVEPVDLAHRVAADHHLVAGDELSAGLEHQAVAMVVVAAEDQQQGDEDDRKDRPNPGQPAQEDAGRAIGGPHLQ